jgi:hypothetical protein
MAVRFPETQTSDWWSAPLGVAGSLGAGGLALAMGQPWLMGPAAAAGGRLGEVGGRAVAEGIGERIPVQSQEARAQSMYGQGLGMIGGIGQQALGGMARQRAALANLEEALGMKMSDIPEHERNLILAMMSFNRR